MIASRKIFSVAFGLLSIHASGLAENNPNVIFILADDIGYGDFGCYGAKQIKTPHIDDLAGKGVRFTQAYSPASTSTPSRYALLTGEYAWRVNASILAGDAPLLIDTQKNNLPKMFQQAGYHTGIVGKWHLGLGSKDKRVDFNKPVVDGPLEVGFDYAYFFPATNDRVPCVYMENDRVVNLASSDPIEVSYRNKTGDAPTGKENPELLTLKPHLGHDGTIVNGVSRIGWMKGGTDALWKDEEMADVLLSKAVQFIKSPHNQPYFLYFATHNAHEPRIPSPRFKGKSKAGIYGDVIEEFDYMVGAVVKALKEKGDFDNTIIIITSDNGPCIKEGYQDGALENIKEHDPYAGLRGEKGTLNEGGTRVPFIFNWPQRVKKGFVQNQPFCYMDMLATFHRMLNFPQNDLCQNDSKDGSQLFFDPAAAPYRPYVLTQNNGGAIAVRSGDWKWIPAQRNQNQELYNLKKDPSELHNVQFAFWQIITELETKVLELSEIKNKK